jgi:hypothetical protein
MINGWRRQPYCAAMTTTINRGTIHTVPSSDLNRSGQVSGSSLTQVIAAAGSTTAVTDNRIEAHGNKNPEMINGWRRQPYCVAMTTTHTVPSSDLNRSGQVSGSSLTQVIAAAGSTTAEQGWSRGVPRCIFQLQDALLALFLETLI